MQQQTVLSELDFIFTPRVENKQTFPLYDCLALTKLCQNQSEPSHLTAMFSLLTILIVFPQCDRQKVHPNIFQVLPLIFSFFFYPSPEVAVSSSGSTFRNDLVTTPLQVKPLRVGSESQSGRQQVPFLQIWYDPRQGLKLVLGSIPVHTEYRCLFFP